VTHLHINSFSPFLLILQGPIKSTHSLSHVVLLQLLKDTALRSPGIRSGFYCSMSDLAIFYIGYGLPHRVLILGLSPYAIYLQVAINIVDLSIESEIRPLHRTVLHRSSFDIFKSCSDVASPHVCQFVCPTSASFGWSNPYFFCCLLLHLPYWAIFYIIIVM
jgi:hypothetical protein